MLSMVGYVVAIVLAFVSPRLAELIYVLVAVLFAIYIPELFPTEIRMRASGICNTFGRGATILTPFIVVALFRSYGVGGVLAFIAAQPAGAGAAVVLAP